MRKKHKQPIEIIPDLRIEEMAAEGKCLARHENMVIFVKDVAPGDVVDLKITKKKKSFAEAVPVAFHAYSEQRVEPFCEHFGVCGGCKWQHIGYDTQLYYKQKQVKDNLERIGKIGHKPLEPILGSAKTAYYRNKLEFTFSTQRYRTTDEIKQAEGAELPKEPALGFHAPGLFDKVVPIQTCYLQQEPTNLLLNVLRTYTEARQLEYYDYRKQYGWLRNIILRITRTGEILINLVMHHEDEKERVALLEHIKENVPGITSLNYTINPKMNDTIYDLDVICYYGKEYIEEALEDFRFKISPKSFFQTNTYQAEALYRLTREFAGLTGTEVLYDLYCGTGSIGIFCSKGAKKVIGIEVVEDAVKDAYENAKMNGLDHCQFYAGDVAAICTDEFFAEHGTPDVIITDPPRAGMHEKLVKQILKMRAPKVVYVSCNPATQARDLQLLDEAYKVTRLQPVDMFPHTHHIENIALLELR